MKRLQILAVAYACDPTKGSESGVGWGWVNAMAAEHDITVLTADYNKSNIEEYRRHRKNPLSSNPRFIYVRNRLLHYRPSGMWPAIENSIAKPLMNIAYQDWLNCAFKDAQDEIAKSRYDLLHLITYVGWRFPGTFYRLGIPFVWGPIGGMKNTPWRLLPILGFKGAVYYGGRNLINSLQLGLLRGPRRALRAADNGVIAATSEIQQELRSRFKIESTVICEIGPPHFNTLSPKPRGEGESFRISWSGQHLPGKALPLLLRAAARLTDEFEFTIEILGDGPCNRSWRSLASKLNISQRCHWHGWLPRDQSLSVMKESHVFVITSLKDLTSTVAVEALSLGLPIVSLDHCGFKDLVNEECGIKVRPGSAEQIVHDMASALSLLYTHEPLRSRLAEGAIRRCQIYSWQEKMEAMNDIYSRAVATSELDNAEAPQI